MSMSARRRGPAFLNLLAIRMPVPAVVSILHRVSGVVLFVVWVVMLAALDYSLSSEMHFESLRMLLHLVPMKLAILLVLWAFWHHLFAGIRFLMLDVQVGMELSAARASSWLVIIASVCATVAWGWMLW